MADPANPLAGAAPADGGRAADEDDRPEGPGPSPDGPSDDRAGKDARAGAPRDLPRVEVHVTAAEAYPVFERHVLSARREVVCAFRIFDFSTRLRSPEARAVGEDWFDLILHALHRGVAVTVILSDFDPVVGTDLHGLTWRSLRMVSALRELAPDACSLTARASLHPARVGALPRLLLWPRVDKLMRNKAGRMLRMSKGRRARFRAEHPNTARLLMIEEEESRARPRGWFPPPLSPVTHHQKIACFDGEVAYVGGLDLNERRWDTPAHERDALETWHDVQLTLRDPAVARAIRAHVGEFEQVIHGEAEPSDFGGAILRTLSAKRHIDHMRMSPEPVLSEIADAIHHGIGMAERFVYLETQFLRDRAVAAHLAERAESCPDLRVLIVLPAAPEDVIFGSTRIDARLGEYLQARALTRVTKAFGRRAFVASPARPATAQGSGPDVLDGAPLIYVHSKVSVFDDALAVVGSANLNGRSLLWDTEVAVPVEGPDARRVRERCMAGILGPGVDDPVLLDPASAVDEWRRLALANRRTRPEERRGFVLPHRIAPSRRFGRAAPGVPEEMV